MNKSIFLSALLIASMNSIAATRASAQESVKTQKAADGSLLLKTTQGAFAGAIELDKGEKQDFRVDLTKGKYLVLVDHIPTEGRLSGELLFLKQNGASLSNLNAIRWGGEKIPGRHGDTITLGSNQALRLRLRNDSDGAGKYWVRVVPMPLKNFPAYGFGAKILMGQIGETGNAGTLENTKCAFYKVTIPAGKWSISLAAKSAGRAYAVLYMNAETGILGEMLTVNADTNESKREEKIVTLLKPRTYYFQIWNEGATDTEEVSYDLTIIKEN
jgi:hypothetical protein